ncbi:MAG TPA: ABC transporter substrate-binding protein [Bacteroidales bacterium]|nr:ABC transporter substrate-binding protein [Bacteroidales bacterium]
MIILLGSCRPPVQSPDNLKQSDSPQLLAVHYAGGFEMTDVDTGILLTVRNPWQHSTGVEYRYLLSNRVQKSEIKSENFTIVKTPVTRIICLSTTHIGFIQFFHKASSIIGISGKDYVVNDSVRDGIAENRIFDVGYDENLNYELILRLRPDVVFAYGVNVSVTNTVRKLNELGIPVILIGEYLEQDPLGKMEWVKVFGACYGMGKTVSERFDSVTANYNQFKELASKEGQKPSVLLGLPWRGSWYVSGSKSYIARLISDAGGQYIWGNLNYNESVPVALEKIYENALTAEYWINPGEARSIIDVISVDERFKLLPALTSGKVFNNDRYMSASGGNGFYESGVTEPDIILSDLIYILHPHLLPSHNLKYYRKLQ